MQHNKFHRDNKGMGETHALLPVDENTLYAAIQAYKQTGFLAVNKLSMRVLGCVPATVLAYYIDQMTYFWERCPENSGWFYKPHEEVAEDLGLTVYMVKNTKKQLIDMGIMHAKKAGLPAKEWLTIDFSTLDDLLSEHVLNLRGSKIDEREHEEENRENLPLKNAVNSRPQISNGQDSLNFNTLASTNLGGHIINDTINNETKDKIELSEVDSLRSISQSINQVNQSRKVRLIIESSEGRTIRVRRTRRRSTNLTKDSTAPSTDAKSSPASSSSQHKAPRAPTSEKNKPFLPLAEKLADIVRTKKRIRPNVAQWADEIRKLANQLIEDDLEAKIARIDRALDWYAEHISDPYVPVIESGGSLRQKFSRLEAAMERDGYISGPAESPPRDNRSSYEIYQDALGVELGNIVMNACHTRAKELFSGTNVAENALAEAIVSMYDDIDDRQTRAASRSIRKITEYGPTNLIREYLKWLGEAHGDWMDTVSLKLLSIDHPLFRRFCLQYARKIDPLARHPLTGRPQLND